MKTLQKQTSLRGAERLTSSREAFPASLFPTQAIGGGQKDARYLWPEMLRAIDEIRPTWVVGENVAGITTMVEGGVLTEVGEETPLFEPDNIIHGYELESSFTIERICSDLEHIGYSVQPMLIPAAAVGAPHRRDRIFIIAFAPDSDNSAKLRGSEKHEGESQKEWLSQRDDIQRPGKPINVRQTLQAPIENTHDLRCGYGENDQQGNQRNIGNAGAGDSVGIRGEERIHTSDTYGWGSGEVPSSVHSRLSDGNEPISDGGKWDVTDSDGKKLQRSGRSRLQEDEGRNRGTKDNRRSSGITGIFTHSLSEGLEGQDESGSSEGREWVHLRRNTPRYDWATGRELIPEERWRDFPTISPVHRGNDGLPFRLDDLTISQSKWRTESLKAYGNAIVPQVMYRIFQAIDELKN